MTGNVASLFGGPCHVPEPNEDVVNFLEKTLVAAQSGEVVGIAVSLLHCDNLASYAVVGKIGSYGIIGAIELAKAELLAIHIGDDE